MIRIWGNHNVLTNFQYYEVIQTDAQGNDYTSEVLLSPQEARDRIVNGRLLSAAEGRQRNYARLWEEFKAIQSGLGGGSNDTAWQSQNLLNQAKEKGQI